MVVLKTPDEFLRMEVSTGLYRSLYFYVAALFALVTKAVSLQMPDPDYVPTFEFLTKELVGDQYGHPFRNDQDLIDLLKRSDAIDVDHEVELNFNCLPDQPGEIAYDEALHKVQGAIHGLVYFLTPPISTFYSPGQVLDIKHCFQYCKLGRDMIGPLEVRSAFDTIAAFFDGAAGRGDGAMQVLDD